MKTYIAVMLTLIVFVLTGIGYLYYKDIKIKENLIQNNQNNIEQEVAVKDTKKVEEKDIDTTKPNITDIETIATPMTPKGSVSGKLCYPSSGIPELEIYAKNTATAEVKNMYTTQNQAQYIFKDLEAGTYIFYAYVKDDMKKELGGGYTEMVPCGLKYGCEDHTLIKVKVESNKMAEGIDICDWYGADLP